MPRKRRQIAASGYYHVILRGCGKRILFETDSDRRYFLSLLERYGEKYELKYLAWCLMDNHVHLLLKDEKQALSRAMHDIAFVFAQHFNAMTDSVGSVFQRPFSSFPVENERNLLRVMRYIHNNPLRAGIAGSLSYPWSSYDDYFSDSSLTDTALILGMLGGVDEFRKFCSHFKVREMIAIDSKVNGRPSDSEAIEQAKQLLNGDSPTRIPSYKRKKRDACIRDLLDAGLPIRQIARITGLGRSIVVRIAAKKAKAEAEQKRPAQMDLGPIAYDQINLKIGDIPATANQDDSLKKLSRRHSGKRAKSRRRASERQGACGDVSQAE